MSNTTQNRRAKKPADSTLGKRKRPDPDLIAAKALQARKAAPNPPDPERRRKSSRKDAMTSPREGVLGAGAGQAVSIATSGAIAPSEGDVDRPLIPSKPNPKWPNWALDYLEARLVCRTDGAASNKIGLTFEAVYAQRLKHADFDAAVQKVRQAADARIVSGIEDKTLARALKSDPDDRMSATLGLAHLKARDHRYRDHAAPQAPTINIVMGFTIPDVPEGQVLEAEFDDEPDDFELPANAKVIDVEEGVGTRPGVSDILTEDDLDI